MAKDALFLIDSLSWARCHVVGISMGGMISMELALLAPERILSLTLMVTHAGGLMARSPLVGIRHILRTFVLKTEQEILENFLQMLYSSKTLNDPERKKVRFIRQRRISDSQEMTFSIDRSSRSEKTRIFSIQWPNPVSFSGRRSDPSWKITTKSKVRTDPMILRDAKRSSWLASRSIRHVFVSKSETTVD